MVKTLELAIWDYDGVLVDSFKDVHFAYTKICSELAGKYFEDIGEFQKQYNAHKNHIAFLESLGITRDKHARADEIFKEELTKVEPVFFEGIQDTLRKIYRGMDMVRVSSAHRSEIIPRLAVTDMLHLFMNIAACETNGKYFHKSEPIRNAIAEYALSPDNAIMIGDRDVDFSSAREAGIPAENIILVDYGWGYDREARKSEGYCLKTMVTKPLEIINAIKEIEMR